MNEAALIEIIQRVFPRFEKGLGIGDDAAMLDPGGRIAITTDMLIEGRDFTDAIPAGFIARKSLAANLSDLAAMGASPLVFTLALGLPVRFTAELEVFLQAMSRLARQARIDLVGGDLSGSDALVVSITAIGKVQSRPLLRSGARPGERIYLSRPIGGAAAGLALLGNGWSIDADGEVTPPVPTGYALKEFAQAAILRQVAPQAETELGVQLAAIDEVSACIDVSDGLSTDLHRLCRASNVGARIEWERIPALGDLERSSRPLGIDGQRAMLHGGEEFCLLFTSSLRESEMSVRTGRPMYAIGRTTDSSGITLERNGVESPFEAQGFDHFAPPS